LQTGTLVFSTIPNAQNYCRDICAKSRSYARCFRPVEDTCVTLPVTQCNGFQFAWTEGEGTCEDRCIDWPAEHPGQPHPCLPPP
jgi:hypothetical protein